MLNKFYSYFFNKAVVERERFINEERQAPWRSRFFILLYIFFLEIASSFFKFIILIAKPSFQSFQIFTNQRALPVCEYSYFDHKRFQKKMRLFSAAGLSSVIAATIIINLVLSLIAPGQLPSYAKTVNGPWDDWSLNYITGDPASGSDGATNPAGSPIGAISISPSGSSEISGTGDDSVLRLPQVSYAVTDTSDTADVAVAPSGGPAVSGGRFTIGADDSNVAITGSGDTASVQLNVDSGTGADGAYSCTSGTCSLAGGTKNYTTFNISSGATVNVTGTSALIIEATGAVTINGTLNLNGSAGSGTAGGAGGPGASSGGIGGAPLVGDGTGLGAGFNWYSGSRDGSGFGAGHGGAGGEGQCSWDPEVADCGDAGSTYDTGDVGGSGGSAGCGTGSISSCNGANTGGGGGGGGSVRIVSGDQVNIGSGGIISVNGGNGGTTGTGRGGAGGSGGRVEITATSITNNGSIAAIGGSSTVGAGGGGGRIILKDGDGTISGSGTPTLTSHTSTAAGGIGYGGGVGNGSSGIITINLPTYYSSGTFTSATIDLGASADFTGKTLTWSETLPSGTDVQIQMRSASTQGGLSSATWYGPTGTGNYYTASGGSINSAAHNGAQWIQYKAVLTSPSPYTTTPTLNNLVISYSQYPTTSAITNLVFDTTYPTVSWANVSWVRSDTTPTSSAYTAKVQARVASQVSNLASAAFVGYDGTTTGTTTYFDRVNASNCSEAAGKFGDTIGANAAKTTVTCTINQANTVINSAANQVLELKLILASDGSNTPQIDAARATYSINSNPEVCAQLDAADPTSQTCDAAISTHTVSQSQSSDNYGHITFNTYIRDSDTADGNAAPGEDVLVGLEYSDTSGNFSQSSPPSSATYYVTGNFAQTFTITPNDAGLTCTATGLSTAWKYLCTVNSVTNSGENPLKFGSYTIDWNAKQDLSSRYSTTQKVRLIINDQEGINPVNIATPATSGNFTMDTGNPTGALTSDARTGNISIAFTDDSTVFYKLSENCTNWVSGQSWTTLQSSWTGPYTSGSTVGCSFATANEQADRTSIVYFSLRDAYGNEQTASSVTTGQRPQNVALQDVSNVLTTPSSYKSFLSWGIVDTPANGFAQYSVYRCAPPVGGSDPTCAQTGNYSLIGTASPTGDKAVNYYTDSSVVADGTYYYRIATLDSLGNISNWSTGLYGVANGTQDGGEGGGGGDTTPTTISGVQIPSANIAQTSATITWTTNETANAGVFYGASYGNEKSTLSYGTSQSITLTGLASGTTYNVQIKSTDASGNQTICDGDSAIASSTNANNTVVATNSATYCPSGATYSFTTLTTDTTTPVISNVSVTPSAYGAAITWTTDESADSYVGIDSATASRTYLNEQGNSDMVTGHTVTIGALQSQTTYYIKIKSRDAQGNLAQNCSTELKTDCSSVSDASFVFTTLVPPAETGGGGAGKSDFTPPAISEISESGITGKTSTVVWTTNELASSFIEYGLTQDKLERTQGQFDNVSGHKVALQDLTPGTRYYYKIKSVDWAGNVGSSDIKSFTTKSEIIAQEGGTEEQKEKTQEVLAELKQQLETQGQNISDPLQALLESVSALIPEPIIIGESPEIEVNSSTATIKWRTDKNSTSFVALAREDEYNPKAEDPYKSVVGNPTDSVKEHIVEVVGLLPGTRYNYQVRSKALLGGMSKSKNFSFTTKSELPQIVKYLQKKAENEKTAVIYWETSMPTDSVVKYTPYIRGVLAPKQSKIQGKPDMVADHEIQITGLDPGTVYQIEVSGRDPFGNAVSKILPDFTTAIDKDAPVISQVRIESAMISGKTPRIQTIVSWRTDELATGQIFFAEGAATEQQMKSLPFDESLSTTHTAVITEFKPAFIYRIKIESKDEAGNMATSRDFTILTPAQSESIIDIIVKTFENTFGWVKNIRF